MFLNGRAIFWNMPHSMAGGGRIAFARDCADHLDGTRTNILLNHDRTCYIAEGRVRVRPEGLWFECDIEGETLQAVQSLLRAGKIRGASYNAHGLSETRMDEGGEYQFVRKIVALYDCGPASHPRGGALTSCRLSAESVLRFQARPINLPRAPQAMHDGRRLMAAAANGDGLFLRGRKLNTETVQALAAGGPHGIM